VSRGGVRTACGAGLGVSHWFGILGGFHGSRRRYGIDTGAQVPHQVGGQSRWRAYHILKDPAGLGRATGVTLPLGFLVASPLLSALTHTFCPPLPPPRAKTLSRSRGAGGSFVFESQPPAPPPVPPKGAPEEGGEGGGAIERTPSGKHIQRLRPTDGLVIRKGRTGAERTDHHPLSLID
jgi:hypothetical protein